MQTKEELAGVFGALADPLRLRLLEILPKAESPEPICVCDLAKKLGGTRDAVRVGVSVGIKPNDEALHEQVAGFITGREKHG